MRGGDLLRAPEDKQKAYVAGLAAARGLPSERSSGDAWSCFLAMSKGNQDMVLKHEAALEAAGFSARAGILTNISQKPDYMGPFVSGVVPVLLRKSLLWSFKLRRLVLATEMLELQGYNIYGNPDKRSPLSPFVSHLRDSTLQSLAGVQVVGTVLIFVTACAVRR